MEDQKPSALDAGERDLLTAAALRQAHKRADEARADAMRLEHQVLSHGRTIEVQKRQIADQAAAHDDLVQRLQAEIDRLHRTIRQMAVQHGELSGRKIKLAGVDPADARTQHIHDLTEQVAQQAKQIEELEARLAGNAVAPMGGTTEVNNGPARLAPAAEGEAS